MKALQQLKHLWQDLTLATIAGVLFALASLGVLIWIAVLGTDDKPLTATQSALLVVLAGSLQLSSAYMFSKQSRIEPSATVSALRHSFFVLVQTRAARKYAETARDTFDESALRGAVGELSVHLGYIEEGIAESAQQWRDMHPDAERFKEEGQ